MALATNAGNTRRSTNVKRAVTDAERANMVRIATAELRKNGVSVPPQAKIETRYLFGREVDASRTKVLIGYFSILPAGARQEIFLIVGPKSRIELAWYHRTTDLEDYKDSQDLRFVEQLDLDGDETDEVVLEVAGYEYEAFWIFKRQNGLWTRVWIGGEGGC
jgi:hypothetical protein